MGEKRKDSKYAYIIISRCSDDASGDSCEESTEKARKLKKGSNSLTWVAPVMVVVVALLVFLGVVIGCYIRRKRRVTLCPRVPFFPPSPIEGRVL